MGSFVGHVVESSAFILLGTYWTVRFWIKYFECLKWGRAYRASMTYPFPLLPNVPVEGLVKMSIGFTGVAGEWWSGDNPEAHTLSPAEAAARNISGMDIHVEGEVHGVNTLQHIQVFSFFGLTGLIDVLLFYRVPLPRGSDHLVMAMAMISYGLTFWLHEEGKPILERRVHRYPALCVLVFCACVLLELSSPHQPLLTLTRNLCFTMQGTWYFNSAFILYQPAFPGWKSNPRWSVPRLQNVHFLVVLFVLHLGANLLFSLLVFAALYLLRYRRHLVRDHRPRDHRRDGRESDPHSSDTQADHTDERQELIAKNPPKPADVCR